MQDEFADDDLLRVLRDPRFWEEEPRFIEAEEVAAMLDQADAENDAAAALCATLLTGPSAAWAGRVSAAEGTQTAAMVQQLLERMPSLIERDPAAAFQVTAIALSIANALDPRDYWTDRVMTLRGQAQRDHAYVLSFLGRYGEATLFVERAEQTFAQVPCPDFDLARLALVKASILRMQDRAWAAIDLARKAAAVFLDLGERRRHVNARITEAGMLYEAGAVQQAMDVWTAVQNDRGVDAVAAVRIAHNIAVCLCDLGRQSEAVAPLERCMAEFEQLGLVTERTRSRWYLGNALRGTDRRREATSLLRTAWRELTELDMTVDAALAALDLAEALAANGTPAEVPAICQRVIAQLTAAGLVTRATPALALLREVAAMTAPAPELIRRTQATVRAVGREARLFAT